MLYMQVFFSCYIRIVNININIFFFSASRQISHNIGISDHIYITCKHKSVVIYRHVYDGKTKELFNNLSIAFTNVFKIYSYYI